MKPYFRIDAVTLAPTSPERAKKLLNDLGIGPFEEDTRHMRGHVFGHKSEHFEENHTAINPNDLALELLYYSLGRNWMQVRPWPVTACLTMFCDEGEYKTMLARFAALDISVAQNTTPVESSPPGAAGVVESIVFDTREALGVDLRLVLVQFGYHPKGCDVDA